jgi:hypothetical protein
MTHLPIWRSSNPSAVGQRPLPMDPIEARAWQITRERHPKYYERKQG